VTTPYVLRQFELAVPRNHRENEEGSMHVERK
jgi:hypothetical protein